LVRFQVPQQFEKGWHPPSFSFVAALNRPKWLSAQEPRYNKYYSLYTIYMALTLFLAQIWGPILVAVGLGFFFSRSYYVKVYRDLEKDPFAVLFFGMFAMAAAIVQLHLHNIWDTLPQIVVSALGWGLLLKGVICTTFPRLADRGGNRALDAKVVPAAGSFALLIGAYLSWIAYFA
jgi:hypothetical protein